MIASGSRPGSHPHPGRPLELPRACLGPRVERQVDAGRKGAQVVLERVGEPVVLDLRPQDVDLGVRHRTEAAGTHEHLADHAVDGHLLEPTLDREARLRLGRHVRVLESGQHLLVVRILELDARRQHVRHHVVVLGHQLAARIGPDPGRSRRPCG